MHLINLGKFTLSIPYQGWEKSLALRNEEQNYIESVLIWKITGSYKPCHTYKIFFHFFYAFRVFHGVHILLSAHSTVITCGVIDESLRHQHQWLCCKLWKTVFICKLSLIHGSIHSFFYIDEINFKVKHTYTHTHRKKRTKYKMYIQTIWNEKRFFDFCCSMKSNRIHNTKSFVKCIKCH